MKKTKTLIIILVVLSAVIIAAALLYNYLGKDNAPDQLVTMETKEQSEKESQAETEEQSEAESQAETEEQSEAESQAETEEQSEAESQAETEDTAETKDSSEVYAPDFLVYDMDGNEVRLSDFLGAPVLLNFWATWCGPCQSEMPDLEEAYQEYGDRIQFVMVNLTDGFQETRDSVKAFLEESGYTFPVYLDYDSDASGTYGISGIPSTFFIDENGVVQGMVTGAMTAGTIARGIDMIL